MIKDSFSLPSEIKVKSEIEGNEGSIKVIEPNNTCSVVISRVPKMPRANILRRSKDANCESDPRNIIDGMDVPFHKYECQVKDCQKNFKRSEDLTLHSISDHSKTEVRYRCRKCDLVLTKANYLIEHFKNRHRLDTMFDCPYCNKIMKTICKGYIAVKII